MTIANYLYHLWLTLQYICPSEDWSWLLTISKRIAAQAKQKPEKHHLVTSETLYALGIELMDRVITQGKPATTRTMQNAYRGHRPIYTSVSNESICRPKALRRTVMSSPPRAG